MNSTHSASKKDIAVGEYLLKQAAEAGDTQRVVELAAQIAAEGTRAGQIVQAMRMLKKLDGAGQAIALDTTLKKLQAELDRNKKNKTFLEVPPELRERLVAAKGEQQVGEVMDEIYQNIADQLPVHWSDKWNAWRYLSMLGNMRTHIRNVLGNAAFCTGCGSEKRSRNRLGICRTEYAETCRERRDYTDKDNSWKYSLHRWKDKGVCNP